MVVIFAKCHIMSNPEVISRRRAGNFEQSRKFNEINKEKPRDGQTQAALSYCSDLSQCCCSEERAGTITLKKRQFPVRLSFLLLHIYFCVVHLIFVVLQTLQELKF